MFESFRGDGVETTRIAGLHEFLEKKYDAYIPSDISINILNPTKTIHYYH